ncbi:MAG: 50S ribosomal protein L25 [Thermoanaerobaculia bacterium]
MLKEANLEVEIREDLGKNRVNRLRKSGKIPGIIYGGDLPAVPISLSVKDFKELLKKRIHENTIFYLKVKGGENPKPALIQNYQIHPVTGEILHIDFIRIDMEKPVKVKVPIEFTGIPVGVKQGGYQDIHLREVHLEAKPKDIPECIKVDVTKLELGNFLRAGEIPIPENCKLLENPDTVIVRVGIPKAVTVEEEKPREEVKEPEVIGKGKKEEEEGEEKEEEKTK